MKVLIALCACLVLASAADFGASSGIAAQSSGGRSCFFTRSVRRVRSIDNRTVYVRVSGDNVFALELFSPCLGVDWARRATLRSRSGSQICEGRGNSAEIFVRSTTSRRERCPVRNVRKLTPEEVSALSP